MLLGESESLLITFWQTKGVGQSDPPTTRDNAVS